MIPFSPEELDGHAPYDRYDDINERFGGEVIPYLDPDDPYDPCGHEPLLEDLPAGQAGFQIIDIYPPALHTSFEGEPPF
ncbi:hypothetical protein [Actinomadura kijaniata]|uniref:hypothetical protein n=1 Tax=Actinomadura kijaniata TaxID=46161 RepID=UPI000830BCDE|nr:hypothetical protein [Actinomadura kijaniata]